MTCTYSGAGEGAVSVEMTESDGDEGTGNNDALSMLLEMNAEDDVLTFGVVCTEHRTGRGRYILLVWQMELKLPACMGVRRRR